MTVPAHRDRIVSGVGGGLAILVVFGLTRMIALEIEAQVVLIASMGATAVLLFAVPHGPMSQPWNVIGGHVVSALVGVALALNVGDPVLAGALAAGLALAAMLYLNCLHPPGGASALIPVLSASALADYGFGFVLFPVGSGAVLMVAIATLYNLNFAWRRYPLWLTARGAPVPEPVPVSDAAGYPDISHADFVAALAEIDSFADIAEEDLLRIYAVAARRHPGAADPVRKAG